jgi:hypothetical protein
MFSFSTQTGPSLHSKPSPIISRVALVGNQVVKPGIHSFDAAYGFRFSRMHKQLAITTSKSKYLIGFNFAVEVKKKIGLWVSY